jgi:hypothetical protein
MREKERETYEEDGEVVADDGGAVLAPAGNESVTPCLLSQDRAPGRDDRRQRTAAWQRACPCSHCIGQIITLACFPNTTKLWFLHKQTLSASEQSP